MKRTRTFTWEDPQVFAGPARNLSGLAVLQQIIAGTLPHPPMTVLMDIHLVEAERGRVVFEATPQEYHYNPLGVLHGGLAATMLDSALGCSVGSHLEAGEQSITLELKVNYVRPLTVETGTVRAIATTIHVGRTTALAEGRVVDAQDRIYAYASSTCLIRRLQPAS